jgi:hypothetical protein
VPELVRYERHLAGFENRLKDRDQVKAKVAESLAVKGRTATEAMDLIADAIRYTFQYHEAGYSRQVLADIALMRRTSELVRFRNFWPGEQYKGISSLWRHGDTGQLFEVQFHTERSYEVMLFTAGRSYARLRSAQTRAQEEIELEAFQRAVYASLPVPPGAPDIPGYPDRGDWEIPGRRTQQGITYYAIVDDLSSRERPAGVLRRRYSDNGRRDEAFTRELAWHRSSLLVSAERGDLENEFVQITAEQASRIVDHIRQSAPRGQYPS